ncbi:UTRA domain-containing protein [Rothia sp. 88186D007BW]
MQREERYVNAADIPDYLEQDFTSITPNFYLGQCSPITRGTHTVEAVLPTSSQASDLQITPTEPCLQLLLRQQVQTPHRPPRKGLVSHKKKSRGWIRRKN